MFDWIHLSDLHFKANTELYSKHLYDSLFSYLYKLIEDRIVIDPYIFITGDIAERGNISTTKEFLERLLTALHINDDKARKRLIFCIGNHDISRGNILRTTLIHAVRNGIENFEKLINDPESLKVLTAPCSKSFQIYNNYLYGNYVQKNSVDIDDILCQKYEFHDLNVIALNTCIFSCDKQDEKNIFVLHKRLYDLFGNLDKSKPIFVIGHHGIKFFADQEQELISHIFEDVGVDAYLCGHEHRLGYSVLPDTKRDIIQLRSGGGHIDNYSVLSFMAGHFDDKDNTVLITPYSYSDRTSREWKADSHIHRRLDGHTKIVLSRLKFDNAHNNIQSIERHINFPNKVTPFIGRKEKLLEIKDKLSKPVILGISGVGGVGKTQLVLEYAYKYASLYNGILWINGDSDSTIMESFRIFAQKIGVVHTHNDAIVLKRSVLEWFEKNYNWLMIFDGVEKCNEIEKYIPNSPNGFIIITSKKNEKYFVKSIFLDVFKPDEAIEFLHSRNTVPEINVNNFPLSPTEVELKFIDKLGALPLALENAMAYIKNTNIDLSEYLKKLNTEETRSYSHSSFEGCETEYSANTIILLIDKIANVSSKQFFHILSYLGTDGVTRNLFVSHAALLPYPLSSTVKKASTFNKIINELCTLSLLQIKDGDGFNIHSNLQETIRKNTDIQIYNSVLKFVDAIFGFRYNTLNEKKIILRNLSFAISAVSFTPVNKKNIEIDLQTKGSIYYKIGRVYHDIGEFEQSLIYQEKVLSIYKKLYGDLNENTAEVYKEMGIIKYSQELYIESEIWLKKSLKIFRGKYGECHRNTGTIYNRLGLLYYKLRKYKSAELEYKKALKIRISLHGPDSTEVAIVQNNIAAVYREREEYKESEELFFKALKIREAIKIEHPHTATIYHEIGKLYSYQRRFDEAKLYFDKAKKVREKILGEKHPNTAFTYYELGKLHYQKKNIRWALHWLEKAKTTFVYVFGKNHLETIQVSNEIKAIISTEYIN